MTVQIVIKKIFKQGFAKLKIICRCKWSHTFGTLPTFLVLEIVLMSTKGYSFSFHLLFVHLGMFFLPKILLSKAKYVDIISFFYSLTLNANFSIIKFCETWRMSNNDNLPTIQARPLKFSGNVQHIYSYKITLNHDKGLCT